MPAVGVEGDDAISLTFMPTGEVTYSRKDP